MDILNYIDKMQQMYGDKEPSSMDQEPRIGLDGGGALTMDVIRVLQDKQNFRDAWKNYKRSTRGSRPLSPGQFFKIWSTENMATGGLAGQLVQPNDDGSRPGYRGEEGGEAFKLKSLQADYDKFGKKKLNKAAKILGFEDYASMSGQENSNFRRKIKDQLTEYGEVLPKGFESDSRGRKKRIKKEQKIQIKLLEETNKNKFFDPKQFAKENKISMDYLKNQAERLQTNIYKKRMLEAGKDVGVTLEWIPKDSKFSDNTLNKLWKSKLIKYEREKIDELFYDAFGRQEIKGTNKKNLSYNPKKFLAVKANLNEYRQLRDAIKLKYPNINLELDHPLSKSTLKKMFNASAEQLTRVNPLEADLNNGFKDSLSQQYEKAMGDPKKGIKPNLNKKKAVEKIARDLKINIGKINKDATNFSYGVKEFQKLNMKDEIIKAIQNQADLSSNFKNYVKQNPELFKTANINPNVKITKITQAQSKAVLSFMKRNDIKCSLSNGINCGRPEAYVKSLNELKAKAAAGDKKAAEQLVKITKGLSTGGKLLRSLIGPGAILAEPIFEGVVAANKVLDGRPLKQAWAESYLSYLDPNRVDPKTLKREEMLYRQIEGPERKVKSGQGTVTDKINIDAPGSSKLKPLFAAEDTMAAFQKAKADKEKVFATRGVDRLDIRDKAAADIRDMRKTGSVDFAQKILNDPATQKALSDAQEYIAAKRGENKFSAQSAQVDEARRKKAMKAEDILTIQDVKNELQGMGDYYGQGYTPFGLNKLFEEAGMQNPGYGITKVGPATGKYNQAQGLQDYLNSMRMQQIADAGGVANMAGGGIAGLSGGDKSGPPPESGPASQGLRSLIKNGRKL